MIKIKSFRTEQIKHPYDVRVDRGNKILGNPFYMANESQRDKVCEQYKEWVWNKLRTKDEQVVNEFKRIYAIYKQYGKLNLFCWCAPKRCHAEEIKRILELKEYSERNGRK